MIEKSKEEKTSSEFNNKQNTTGRQKRNYDRKNTTRRKLEYMTKT